VIEVNGTEALSKRGLKQKIRDWFTSFVSLFIKKEKCLVEASTELTEELEKVNEEYKVLEDDNSFEGLKDTYDTYKIGINPQGGLIAIEKNTGYIKEEPNFVAKVRFASLWRRSAFGNLDMKDEDECVKECFSEDSKGIYDEIRNLIQKQLKKTGNINTLEVINAMKDSSFKWGRTTSRRLFRTVAYAETVTNYFRAITPRCKKQTSPTYSLMQALYGLELDE